MQLSFTYPILLIQILQMLYVYCVPYMLRYHTIYVWHILVDGGTTCMSFL